MNLHEERVFPESGNGMTAIDSHPLAVLIGNDPPLNLDHEQPIRLSWLDSNVSNSIFGILIVTNAVLVGVQVDRGDTPLIIGMYTLFSLRNLSVGTCIRLNIPV
jgi:hypothetical protein